MTERETARPDKEQSSAITRLLNTVEWLGNLLPHPVTLFALLALLILLLSGLLGAMGVSVPDPRPEGTAGRAEDGIIRVISLLDAEGLRRIVTSLVTNFTSFVPLGTVLVAMLGVGIAERSGLLAAAIKTMVLGAPKNLVTVVIVFAAVLSNTASEMGYVVVIPLAAAIFHALGRHPLAGLAAAFAGVSGGYSANLLIGTVDPLLAGITQEAARLIDPAYEVHAAVNWYFMIVSTFAVTAMGWFVTARIVEPKLGPYDPAQLDPSAEPISMEPVSPVEKRALRWSGVAALAMGALIAALVVPDGGWLRLPGMDDTLASLHPFLTGIVVLVAVFFAVPGIVYGAITGVFRSDRDVINAMAKSMATLSLYIVLVFFAAQFVAFFNWTQLGQVIAVLGSTTLQAIGLTGPIVFLFFIAICGLINLSLGSASAQWAVTAPIFVPMLMLVGYSPEVIQSAYRIGDSVTNLITPMMSYFGLIMAFAARYQRNLGVGTLIAMMLPYTVVFFIGWVSLFFLWVFVLGMPVGPGAPTYYGTP
ncbi:AbgT family transporter [Luteimonas aestuarii]|uniref:AbgT family transporter n=1 Tax=Luteimonas aestuarii TaxID=453837 RepID=A0A4R5U1K0_9GAMM|nr:AbgT family transporter [Luteimonas aestuarii]TDK27490.1 AbgT family transporter [Luteimonas aestuarii]